MDEWGVPDTMPEVDALIAQIPSADEPYQLACEVAVAATGATKSAEIAWNVYLVWAGLTDVWEEKQHPDPDALIREAAAEWLAAETEAERHECLDRWKHEILGYERTVPKGWSLVVDQQPDGSYVAHAEDPSGAHALDAVASDLESVWAVIKQQSFAVEEAN